MSNCCNPGGKKVTRVAVPRPNRPCPKPQAPSCKSCGCQGSACSCKFKAPARASAPLNSNCVLVNSVVCSKTVQKVAEATLPIGIFLATLTLTDIISINVVPNLSAITTNARIIKDKVVNIGLIPATITIATTIVGSELLTFNTTIPFQEHTDCPGACPEDLLQETPLQVEGIFVQPGVPVLDVAGLTLVEGILVKIILRTTITVTRQVLVDEDGNFCDVTDRCITPSTPPVFTLPTPPTTGGLLGGV
jgi:hypothetical protein